VLLVMLALAADPPAAPACPGGQRCGEKCIAWTDVCRDTLADSIGLAPPPPVAPGSAPPGSTLLSLPGLHGVGTPTMREDAPSFCNQGGVDPRIAVACVPYWNAGAGASAAAVAPALADCPQHRRCNGVCLDEGQVCAQVGVLPNTDRLSPFEPSTPIRDGYEP